MKNTFSLGIQAMTLVFGMMVVGCLTTGGTTQNNIGEIIGDNFALVRAPASQGGMLMPSFNGSALVNYVDRNRIVFNNFRTTSSILGGNTFDLKVSPGNHEFTMIWLYETSTMIANQSHNFEAGKWYEFKSHPVRGGLAPITIHEGTLDAGRPRGATVEVASFQMEEFNSDEVAPEPQQAIFTGIPGNVTSNQVTVSLRDGPQPGQVILALSDGYKFGTRATAAYLVRSWLSYPTYPITVSPAHCIGTFSPDGTQMLITMRTSNNRTVTTGQVGFRSMKTWDNNQITIPSGSTPNFVLEGGLRPALD